MRILDFTPPVKPNDQYTVGKASPSAQALLLSEILQERQGLLLVITPDMVTAEQLQRNLGFFLKKNQVSIELFPDWEILPYDTFSPHKDIISKRLKILSGLSTKGKSVLIIPVTTLLHRLAPASHIRKECLHYKKGETLEISQEQKRLGEAGYINVDTVYTHGEFAIRGALMDIFPMGSEVPVRLDFFDNTIDSIRNFDQETQRTLEIIDSIEVLPAHEYPLNNEGIAAFKSHFQLAFNVDYRKCPVYMDIASGIASAGAEYYLPLFFEKMNTLFDYLPNNTLTVTTGNIHEAAERFWSNTESRFENYNVDPLRPLLSPEKILLSVDELFRHLKNYPKIKLATTTVPVKKGSQNLSTTDLPDVMFNSRKDNPSQALESFLDHKVRTLFVAESTGRREHLLEIFAQNGINPQPVKSWDEFVENKTLDSAITIAPLEDPLYHEQYGIAMITESQLLGKKVMQRRRRKKATQADQVIRHLSELKTGAPVVHIEHGVGRYEGLQTLNPDGQPQEFLVLRYADDARLYVPVAHLHMISRYTGSGDNAAPLHRLGSEQWQKARKKASERVRDVAAELLDIYAKREAAKGEVLSFSKSDYLAFSEEFPFETTPDQQAAIEATLNDLQKEQPMDRLICGDVGFGKTEVAMRAAFATVSAQKQVAILAPTTLLAQQHFETLSDRFADWPANIEVISRFKSATQTRQIKASINSGEIDIIIGTHKLLDSTIKFKNLGLLVVDEEHRFGVRQKEQMKAMRTRVNILTLTATPIPRTLNMAVASIRDLSIIATPPEKRLSINTFIHKQEVTIIREAIMRELLRGGQVYYLHNDVKTIEKAADDVQKLVPESRVAIGHGQMRERELEQVMRDFYHKRSNILVCTTIIETGIDIPSANTIIIHRADKLGLAQLHQLRGRVGRSHHQAYAYLLTPPAQKVTTDAKKRLEAIASTTELGAGFMLATHDLEIRGAGELLGDEQSGQMTSIGFSLYMDMLEKAVNSLKKGEKIAGEEPLNTGVEINLHVPALIPETYIASPHTRLVLYKKIASCANDSELKELQIELIDRFGLLPEAVKSLFRVSLIKQKADSLGIQKIEATNHGGKIVFAPNARVEPLKLINLIQSRPEIYNMQGSNALSFKIDMSDINQRFHHTEKLLEALESPTPDTQS